MPTALPSELPPHFCFVLSSKHVCIIQEKINNAIIWNVLSGKFLFIFVIFNFNKNIDVQRFYGCVSGNHVVDELLKLSVSNEFL